MPMSSRVSAAQVYSRGHQRARSAKAENARSTGTGRLRPGGSARRLVAAPSGPLGRAFLDGPAGLDVGNRQLQALDRAGGRLDDPPADGDRAGRPGRGQLDHVQVVADPGVVVDGEPDLLAVEAPGPVHIGARDDHDLELPIHAVSPSQVVPRTILRRHGGDVVRWPDELDAMEIQPGSDADAESCGGSATSVVP